MLLSLLGLVLLAYAKDGPTREPTAEKPDRVAAKAEAVFKAHCHRCHGADGRNEANLYILDHKSLIDQKEVIPGDPQRSKVYSRMIKPDDQRPMPPWKDDEDEKPIKDRPNTEEIASILKWIEAGAPEWSDARSSRTLIGQDDIFLSIVQDLNKAQSFERRFFRYFTLTHLYNAGVGDDELETHRGGLAKMLNSLSTQAGHVIPKPIDPARTVLRVDIRTLGWTEETWSRIVAEDPFALIFNLGFARTSYELTGCQVPEIRADAFIFNASRSKLYYDILRLPDNIYDLEKSLGVDSARNIRELAVYRALFNNSSVAVNVRILEWHLRGTFVYVRTYETESNLDRGNFFAFPLGPEETFRGRTRGHQASRFFRADGGEVIFLLPNGFMAYFLVDGQGKRIDQAATTIVNDPRQKDRIVRNAISCFGCHNTGFIPKDDEFRATVGKRRGGFEQGELDQIFALYPEPEVFNRKVAEANATYHQALDRAGVPRGGNEPITFLSRQFEKDLDLPLAAAEAGVTPQELLVGLERNRRLQLKIGQLFQPGGKVKRQTFLEVFPELAGEVQRGVVAFRDQFRYPVGSAWTYRVTIGGGDKAPGYLLQRRLLNYEEEGGQLKAVYLETRKIGPRDHALVGKEPLPTSRPTNLVYVQVPYGAYQAVRIEEDRSDRRVVRWVAHAFGEVRREVQIGGVATIYELVDFEPPPDGFAR